MDFRAMNFLFAPNYKKRTLCYECLARTDNTSGFKTTQVLLCNKQITAVTNNSTYSIVLRMDLYIRKITEFFSPSRFASNNPKQVPSHS